MKLKKEHHTITSFQKPDPLLRRLYVILKATLCPQICYRKFLKFYLNSNPHCMQITFLQHEGNDIGFFTCTYSNTHLLDKKTVICRVAIGIMSQYHGGVMPFSLLCRRIIHYRIQNPFQPIYMVAYLANPIVYATIAKYTAAYWPSRLEETPAFINKLKDSILQSGQMAHLEVNPFVLRIHFAVQFSDTTLKRIYTSNNPDIKYYLSINPDFQKQMGVITIVPVRWANIVANIWKAMIIRPLKKALFNFSRFFC